MVPSSLTQRAQGTPGDKKAWPRMVMLGCLLSTLPARVGEEALPVLTSTMRTNCF
jgi:hypothetical protein